LGDIISDEFEFLELIFFVEVENQPTKIIFLSRTDSFLKNNQLIQKGEDELISSVIKVKSNNNPLFSFYL